MTDYYEVLGVTRSSTEREIKTAYRKLVVQYHPDRNPTPEAAQLIKVINEAYDVLSDPQKKQSYDLRNYQALEDLLQQANQPRHRDPAYHRKRSAASGPRRKSESEQMYDLMISCRPYSKMALWVATAFCIFLILDALLPFRKHELQITKITYHFERKAHTANVLHFAEIPSVKVGVDDEEHFAAGDRVTVNHTRMTNIPFHVKAADGFAARVPITIYSTFNFVPLILLGICLVGLLFPQKVELYFNASVGSVLVLILSIVFLILS